MARVVITSLADADTDAVLDYLTISASGRIAAKHERLFDRMSGLLTGHPEIGAPMRLPLASRNRTVAVLIPVNEMALFAPVSRTCPRSTAQPSSRRCGSRRPPLPLARHPA